MKKHSLFSKFIPPRDLTDLDEFDQDQAEADWRYKANRLQARRWRKVKHQLV